MSVDHINKVLSSLLLKKLLSFSSSAKREIQLWKIIAFEMFFKCKNGEYGCNKYVRGREKNDREKICVFR